MKQTNEQKLQKVSNELEKTMSFIEDLIFEVARTTNENPVSPKIIQTLEALYNGVAQDKERYEKKLQELFFEL